MTPAGFSSSLDVLRQLARKSQPVERCDLCSVPVVEGHAHLLVNRLGAARGYATPEYYLLPIDECFRLVGLIRAQWRGFGGGSELWAEIEKFFAGLKERSSVVSGSAGCLT